MADKLVTVAEYMDSLKADMAKQVLEDFGIQAVIVGRNAADVFGGVTAYFTAIKLQVRQSDAARAKEILELSEMEFNADEPEEFEGINDMDKPDEQDEQNQRKEF